MVFGFDFRADGPMSIHIFILRIKKGVLGKEKIVLSLFKCTLLFLDGTQGIRTRNFWREASLSASGVSSISFSPSESEGFELFVFCSLSRKYSAPDTFSAVWFVGNFALVAFSDKGLIAVSFTLLTSCECALRGFPWSVDLKTEKRLFYTAKYYDSNKNDRVFICLKPPKHAWVAFVLPFSSSYCSSLMGASTINKIQIFMNLH